MLRNALGLIEMTLTFGVVLAFLVWELLKTRRALKVAREKAERE
jgi:hypothetical protein